MLTPNKYWLQSKILLHTCLHSNDNKVIIFYVNLKGSQVGICVHVQRSLPDSFLSVTVTLIQTFFFPNEIDQPGGGALAKNWWRGCLAVLWPFFFNSLSPTDPLFSTRSHSHPTPVFNNSQPIFNKISLNDHLFYNILSKFLFFFQSFCKNVSKFVFSLKIGQNLSNSHHLTPYFWSSHWTWPPFSEQNLSLKDP